MQKRLITILLALFMMQVVIAGGHQEVSQPDDVAELVFWDMMWGKSDFYPDTVQKLVQQFNSEHEDINVTVQILPWNNFYQQFLTAVTSGAAPDISTGGFAQSAQYAAMNELVDLSSIVDEWKADGFIDQFPEGAILLHQYEGIQAGIPWISDPRLITYRKDVFDDLGITKMPSTWKEFLDVCELIKTQTDMTPLAIPGDRDGAQILLSMMFENNVGITDIEGNPSFDSIGVHEVLEYVSTLYDKGYISRASASYTDSDLDSMMLSGNAAMCYGALRSTIYNSKNPIADTLGVMPSLASRDNKTPRTLMWVNPIVAYNQTKHPEEAKVFIKWWVENMLTLFTNGGINGYPTVNKMLQEEFFGKEPYIAEAIKNAVPYGTVPVWPADNLYTAFSIIEGEDYLGMAIQEVLTGNKDIDSILEKYQRYIDQAFQEVK